MIHFTPFRSVRYLFTNNSININIDTLRAIVRKETVNKYIIKKQFIKEVVKKNTKISGNVKKQLFDKKEVTSSYRVILPEFKNIKLSTPHRINQLTDYKCYKLSAFGLFQPHKPISQNTKQHLQKLFNKFSLDSFDLSIDSTHPLMDEATLRTFGAVNIYRNTIYVNNPPNLKHISKIKIYNKAKQLQDQQKTYIPPLYRLELTIQTKGKLKDMFIPIEEIEKVLSVAKFHDSQNSDRSYKDGYQNINRKQNTKETQ